MRSASIAFCLAVCMAAPFQAGAQTTRPAQWSLLKAPGCTSYSPCGTGTDAKAACIAAVTAEIPQTSCVRMVGLTNITYGDTGTLAYCSATANYQADGSCPWYTGGFTSRYGEYVFPYCEIQISATQAVTQPTRIADFQYVCPGVLRIDFVRGGSFTKALVAGPVLPQTVQVTRDSIAVADKPVSVSVAGSGSISGVTDANGELTFTYVPPYKKALDQLTGTCQDCSNTAQKTITVEAGDSCEDKRGNPISIATGEKEQAESDWTDSAAHPLSFSRHYRSFANLDAGLGGRWSHNYAAQIAKTDLEAVVRLGDGNKVLFMRANLASAWVADNRRDTLIESPAGLAYIRAVDESRWQFDAASRLVSITQRNGWVTMLTYNAANQLTSVGNAFGRALQFAYDGQSRLVSVMPPDGQAITYSYDSSGRLAGVAFPGGAGRSYHYEDSRWPAALTGITDESGVRYATFSYDAAGRAIGTQHAGGAQSHTVSYGSGTSSATGALVGGTAIDPSIYRSTSTMTDPLGTAQTYTWQGGDGQVRLLSANGAFEGLQVGSREFATGTTLPVQEADFLGVLTAYSYDLSRQLKLSTTKAAGRPEAQTTNTQWHASFRLPVVITEAGRTTAYSYDNLGNKLSETITDTASGQARTWAWTYNSQGLAESMTDPKGGVWQYGYDSAGNRTSSKNPLGQQTSYSYDAAGRLTSQTEPNGLVTAYSYDARGRLVSQNRGGEVSTFTYAATGQLVNSTLPNGFQVSYSYDAAQRLIAATDNRGNSVQYTLDAAGNRLREEVKDVTGTIALVTGRIINSLNKVAAIQGSVGQTTALAYDANGEPIAQTDPLNQTTRQSLDGLRRPTATTFADNSQASQAWNQLDQITQVTDPKGVQTRYQTNAFGDVVSETSPDIGTIAYTRDASGEVIAIQDAKGQINRIERDALGRPILIEYAQGNTAYFSYDAGGYVSRVDDKSGSTLYTRDAQGRVLAKTQSVNDNPSSPTQLKISYSYQGGELASIGYPSGLKVFYARTAGRITAIDVQEPPNPSGKTIAASPFVANLTHSALGQPKSWTWKFGDSASRSFDADGRMTQSEIASYSWDAASRVTSITQTLWAQRTVTVVINGKTQTVTQLYQTPISWNAGYDARNRLTSFARTGADTKYSYDANSNRLTAVDTTSSEIDLEAAFDAPNFTQSANQNLNIDAASNKLLGFSQTLTKTQAGAAVSSVTSQVNFSLDANGAITSDGLRTFDYDESRRLSQVKIVKDGEAAAVEYLHNALGQRVFKSEPQAEQTLPNEEELGQGFINWLRKGFGWLFTQGNGSKSSIGMAFIYDEDANLLGEYDNGSALGKGRAEYIWLPTEAGQAIPIGLYRNGKFYQVHSDHLGTPRLITDNTNTAVWQWPYSAFGNNKTTGALAATTGGNGQVTLKGTKVPVEVNLRFPGQYFDEESSLSYNYLRSYLASQGRYSQSDPIGLGAGANRFAYVEGNPLSGIDPTALVKLHGNWCGPDFSGGFSKPYDKLDDAEKKATLPPVDKLDRCCQTHDIVYAMCRKANSCDAKARQKCFEAADRELSSCAANSGSGYGANLLLFGNPKTRISDYMRDSSPAAESNAAECSCTK